MQPEWQQTLDAFYSLSSGAAPEILCEVYERETEGSRDELALAFSRRVLVLQAKEEDDTIAAHLKRHSRFNSQGMQNISSDKIWRQWIGKPFGWGWVTVNQQGYCDGVLLGFDGINPNVSLIVVASAIEIGRVSWPSPPLPADLLRKPLSIRVPFGENRVLQTEFPPAAEAQPVGANEL